MKYTRLPPRFSTRCEKSWEVEPGNEARKDVHVMVTVWCPTRRSHSSCSISVLLRSRVQMTLKSTLVESVSLQLVTSFNCPLPVIDLSSRMAKAMIREQLTCGVASSVFELNTNMRQRGDATYSEVLNHIRTGRPTPGDIRLLRSMFTSRVENLGCLSDGAIQRCFPSPSKEDTSRRVQ